MSDLFETHGELILNCGQHKRRVFLARLQFREDVPIGQPARSLRGRTLAEYTGPIAVVVMPYGMRPDTAAERKAHEGKIARNRAQGIFSTVGDIRVSPPPRHETVSRIGTSWQFVCHRHHRPRAYRMSEARLRRLAETQSSVIDLSLTDM